MGVLLTLVLGLAAPAVARASATATTYDIGSTYAYDAAINMLPRTAEHIAAATPTAASSRQRFVGTMGDPSRPSASVIAAEDGMAGVRAAGTAGERAAGIVKNTDHIPSASGTAAYRIPDELNASVLGEVKNVSRLSYTNQLRDFSAYAQSTGRTFNLYVRGSTTFTTPLQEAIDAGQINVIPNLPG